jgi:hypothetical protein
MVEIDLQEEMSEKKLASRAMRIVGLGARLFNFGRFGLLAAQNGLIIAAYATPPSLDQPSPYYFPHWIDYVTLLDAALIMALGWSSLAYLLIRAIVSFVHRRMGVKDQNYGWIIAVEAILW